MNSASGIEEYCPCKSTEVWQVLEEFFQDYQMRPTSEPCRRDWELEVDAETRLMGHDYCFADPKESLKERVRCLVHDDDFDIALEHLMRQEPHMRAGLESAKRSEYPKTVPMKS